MKPADDIHKLIKKLEIKASSELDRKIRSDISNAMAESAVGPTMWRMTLAVAAGIIIAFGVGFFVGQQSKSMPAETYSLNVNNYTSATSVYSVGKSGFWQQKVVAAMQPRPYAQNRFDKAGLLKTYRQYLKEKHYD